MSTRANRVVRVGTSTGHRVSGCTHRRIDAEAYFAEHEREPGVVYKPVRCVQLDGPATTRLQSVVDVDAEGALTGVGGLQLDDIV